MGHAARTGRSGAGPPGHGTGGGSALPLGALVLNGTPIVLLQSTDLAVLTNLAPVAKQQGQYVAAVLIARQKAETIAPFRYRDFGSLATIGRKRAIIQMGRLKLKGFIAWLLWCVAHIYYLIGFRNRFVVAISWLWNYITSQRATRRRGWSLSGLMVASHGMNASCRTSSRAQRCSGSARHTSSCSRAVHSALAKESARSSTDPASS